MKQWILLAAALLAGIAAQAQPGRYYVGGNISLGASNYGTSIVVYPEVGKRVNDWLMVGLAAGFDWNNISSESDFTMGVIPHVRGYLPVYGRFGLTGDTYFAARWTRRRGYDPLISTQTLGFRPGIYFPIGNVTLSTQIELPVASPPGSPRYPDRGAVQPIGPACPVPPSAPRSSTRE